GRETATMLSQINLALWAWLESFRDFRRGRVWVPFVLLGFVQLAVVLLLTQFYRPVVSAFLVPLVRLLVGPTALHYPQFYMALPSAFGRLNPFLDWLVGSFILGAAALVLWHTALGLGQRGTWSVAARRYLSLLGVRLPLLALLLGVAWVLPTLILPDAGELRGNSLRMFRYGTFVFGVLLEMLFVYAPVVLLLEPASVGPALLRGFRMVGKVPLATALVVGGPNLFQLPISWALRRSDTVVQSLNPELVIAMLAGAVVLYVGINYFILASVVRIYGARGTSREEPMPWKA
ncbi:MAG: hypothetical protein KC729_20075, partial [Candidatus Eisenbacteria bacterium]|nr:hypothetical protein [Candidatus Eisenbacteria bacterium]